MMTPRIDTLTAAIPCELKAISSDAHASNAPLVAHLAIFLPSLIVEPEIHYCPKLTVSQHCRSARWLHMPRQGVTAMGQK